MGWGAAPIRRSIQALTVATALAVLAAAILETASADLRHDIQAAIHSGDPALGAPTRVQQEELRALYRNTEASSHWLDVSGRPNDDARAALALLASATDEGLDPADYDQRQLNRLIALLGTGSAAPPDERARFDVALSARMLRYLRDLHMARVDPRTIGFPLSVPVDQHDFAALLRLLSRGIESPRPLRI